MWVCSVCVRGGAGVEYLYLISVSYFAFAVVKELMIDQVVSMTPSVPEQGTEPRWQSSACQCDLLVKSSSSVAADF